jgi:hypothetical protein
MFNRALQIKMIKDEKTNTPPPQQSPDFDRKVTFVTKQIRDLAADGAKCVVLYIVLDTVRKVAVEMAKK